MRPFLALAASLATACQLTTPSLGPSEPAPGARAEVVVQQLQVAGGTPWLNEVAFDSATLSFVSRTCPRGSTLDPCPGVVSASGRADATALADVFRVVNSSTGRSLRPVYSFEGNVRPPDAAQFTVTVVSNGQRWRVQWDPRAQVPRVLPHLLCRLEQARGSLALCSQD